MYRSTPREHLPSQVLHHMPFHRLLRSISIRNHRICIPRENQTTSHRQAEWKHPQLPQQREPTEHDRLLADHVRMLRSARPQWLAEQRVLQLFNAGLRGVLCAFLLLQSGPSEHAVRFQNERAAAGGRAAGRNDFHAWLRGRDLWVVAETFDGDRWCGLRDSSHAGRRHVVHCKTHQRYSETDGKVEPARELSWAPLR